MKKIRSVIDFYMSFAFSSIAITFACLYIVVIWGIGTFFLLFWFKIITLAMIWYLTNMYKNHEFYYYKNLGLSKRLLWTSTLSIDMILYLTCFFLTLKFK